MATLTTKMPSTCPADSGIRLVRSTAIPIRIMIKTGTIAAKSVYIASPVRIKKKEEPVLRGDRLW